MYSCDVLLAADSVLKELSHVNAVLDILRRVNPDLVTAAEIEALSTP